MSCAENHVGNISTCTLVDPELWLAHSWQKSLSTVLKILNFWCFFPKNVFGRISQIITRPIISWNCLKSNNFPPLQLTKFGLPMQDHKITVITVKNDFCKSPIFLLQRQLSCLWIHVHHILLWLRKCYTKWCINMKFGKRFSKILPKGPLRNREDRLSCYYFFLP